MNVQMRARMHKDGSDNQRPSVCAAGHQSSRRVMSTCKIGPDRCVLSNRECRRRPEQGPCHDWSSP
eukprot:14471874-Alexandrium_andersonii.AAC.1